MNSEWRVNLCQVGLQKSPELPRYHSPIPVYENPFINEPQTQLQSKEKNKSKELFIVIYFFLMFIDSTY